MSMRLPVFPFKGSIPVYVDLTQGMSRGGVPNVQDSFIGTCHFDETGKTVIDKDGTSIKLSGIVLIIGDIFPNQEIISGNVSIGGGQSKKIHNARRIRDLTGKVHHVTLELI